jgi:hypothetical protein
MANHSTGKGGCLLVHRVCELGVQGKYFHGEMAGKLTGSPISLFVARENRNRREKAALRGVEWEGRELLFYG